MYDYIIEEMADAIANELHVDNNDVLRILHRYWEDKIAHVWRSDHIVHCAFNMGKPILMGRKTAESLGRAPLVCGET